MARRLRSEGLSVREIESRLGVARSSVSLWVRDVALTAEQRETLRTRPRAGSDRFRRRRLEYQDVGRATARCREPLQAMGCMLFWAEGSRSINAAHITNSDPPLLRDAAAFLRAYFHVPDE